MCGKFTSMASWREVVEFSQPLGIVRDASDEEITYGVARPLPVIVWQSGDMMHIILDTDTSAKGIMSPY